VERALQRIFGIFGYQLSTELSWLSPLIALPGEEEGGVLLGEDRFGRQVYLNFATLKNAHGLVAGPSGSGKSTLLRDIGLKWLQLGGRAVYVDPSGEHAEWWGRRGGHVIDLRRGIDALAPLSSLGEEWMHRLARIVGTCLNWSPHTTTLFEYLLNKYDSISGAVKEAAELTASGDLVARPIAIASSALQLLEGGSNPLDAWRATVTVLSMGEMSEDLARLLASVAIDAVWREGIRRGMRHAPELLVLMDEAHRFVDLRPFTEQSYVEGIARVVRKYAVGVIFASQRLYDIPPAVREQVAFKLALPGSSSSYLQSVRDVLGASDDQIGWLASAQRGRALVYKEGAPRPSAVNLRLADGVLG